MYALITDPAGSIVEVVVLATGPNRMRVAAAGFPDAFELRLSDGRWLTETGEAVEFEFLASSAAPGLAYFMLETKISGRGSLCVTPSRGLPHTQHRSSSHPRHQLHVGHCQIFTTPLS